MFQLKCLDNTGDKANEEGGICSVDEKAMLASLLLMSFEYDIIIDNGQVILCDKA